MWCPAPTQEYKCEICGEASYWGRRAFERHFKEWRHQNGMRALGIPNNKNFYEVTQIEEAQALWVNIKVCLAVLFEQLALCKSGSCCFVKITTAAWNSGADQLW